MTKNKLVHVITNLEVGGAQAVLYNIIKAGRADYDQEVIYFRPGPFVVRLQELGIPVHQVNGWLFRYDLIFMIRLCRLLQKLKPDIVHSLLWAANVSTRIISFLTNIPLITVYHNNVDQDGLIRSLLDQLSLKISKGPLVTVSQGVKDALVRRNAWSVTRDSLVIANGIDSEWIAEQACIQAKPRHCLGLKDEDFVLGTVGRLCVVKNYSFLIEIFSLLTPHYSTARLVIVGSGPEEHFLRMLVNQHGLHDYVTFIIGESAYGYYQLFDCFVQSSREGISMALLEAMSLKVPAVVVHSDKEHAVIKDGINGLVMPADSAYRCMQTIEKIIEDNTLRNILGYQGQKTVSEQFNSVAMFRLYDTLFKQISK